MILQALYDYYERKANTPDSGIAPFRWEWKEIPYRIVINSDGCFISIEDTREGDGKNKRAKKFLVPEMVKRTGNIASNLLWDNIEYALGANPRGRDDIEERFNLFKARILNEIKVENYPSVTSLLKFLDNNPVEAIKSSGYREIWQQMEEENPFVIFKIDGCTHSSICDDINKESLVSPGDSKTGVCLVTGNSNIPISRLHQSLKGVRGTNTQGASLVSFNLPPFTSYNKAQNFNAPVSEIATHGYTTALNNLLSKDSKNKISIGDTTVVFWRDKQETVINPDEIFSWVIAARQRAEDNPDAGTEVIKRLFDSIITGQIVNERTNRFYILGLAPNAARISVRFWKTPSVEDFGRNIKQHFDDFEIIHDPKDKDFLSLYQILSATALEYKVDNVPKNLAGSVIESIIDGKPYPRNLLNQCMIRIRAERNVNRTRAAIIKAYFNRLYINKSNQKEITMALDQNNTNTAYRLGRLFAVLEKIQEAANPGINATIRDKFYGAASTSPVTVFPRLLNLKNSHLKKVENQGIKIFYEKLIGEIMNCIDNFPANLPLNDQAYFAIGYYHQRQDFFIKKSDKSSNESESNNQ